MGETTIAWTERTWNPVRGCSRISPGCQNCYAERMAARGLPGHRSPTTGHSFAIMQHSGPRWTGKVELIPHMLAVPLKRRKPTTYFVNSMSDLFHEDLPFEAIDRVFAAMALCSQHTFQVLTKRAGRMREYMQRITAMVNGRGFIDSPLAAATRAVSRAAGHRLPGNAPLEWWDNTTAWEKDKTLCHTVGCPPRNVWLGVSVEDQQRKDCIDELRETPAAIRFLSLEPLLEDLGTLDLRGIHWVIVGGESGPGARPCDIQGVRSIVAQCKAAGVACFVKQLGARPQEIAYPQDVSDLESARWMRDGWTWIHEVSGSHWRKYLRLKDRKGGTMDEWPTDLRIREMPAIGVK